MSDLEDAFEQAVNPRWIDVGTVLLLLAGIVVQYWWYRVKERFGPK